MKRQPRFGSAVDNGDLVAIIPLTQNQHTIISPIDLGKIDQVNWYAQKRNTKHKMLFDACSRHSNGRNMARVIETPSKNQIVDHINGNSLDNRRSNLQVTSQRKNCQNRHLKYTSKYPGVSWHKGKQRWQAHIFKNGKNKSLGRFNTEEKAFEAYKKANKLLRRS